MSTLKVVALISGGKDSLFSILHCIANRHEVVALANLYPGQLDGREPVEDIESYMYQTIGHAVIPLYEHALGLPLFRQQILGESVNQDKSYVTANDFAPDADQDETESLVPLLRKVIAAHPEVNAVSTGAILSDYQRTRVESVALRLGLIPLSYLWQWPSLPPYVSSSLLQDMTAVGQDSRIIKAASGGLDDTFLWQNVAAPSTIARLTKAAALFGTADEGAALGEGGEYETLAVSGPPPLWKVRIVIDESHRNIMQGDAGSFSLKIQQAYLAPLEASQQTYQTVRVPDLLDRRFQGILDELTLSRPSLFHDITPERDLFIPQAGPVKPNNAECDGAKFLSNLVGQGSGALAQTQSIMEKVLQRLTALQYVMSDIAYASIILRDMADFPLVNSIYGRYFTKPNPPARVTIACADVLPQDCYVMMSMTSFGDQQRGSRQGLHVQSRSYWAPANIGPYSQAISIAMGPGSGSDNTKLVYVAGQIPLVPASMELPDADSRPHDVGAFEQQTVLALQHLSRIGVVMQVSCWAAAIAFVTIDEPAQRSTRVNVIRAAWEAMHRSLSQPDEEEEHDENFDVWYANSTRGTPIAHNTTSSVIHDGRVPSLYIVHVDALPRGCSVEWASYGIVGSVDRTQSLELTHMWDLLDKFRHRILSR